MNLQMGAATELSAEEFFDSHYIQTLAGFDPQWLDDSFATLMAWPFVLAQLEMEVDVNPDGRNAGPMYFADVEELEQVLAEAADKDAPKVVGQGAEA